MPESKITLGSSAISTKSFLKKNDSLEAREFGENYGIKMRTIGLQHNVNTGQLASLSKLYVLEIAVEGVSDEEIPDSVAKLEIRRLVTQGKIVGTS